MPSRSSASARWTRSSVELGLGVAALDALVERVEAALQAVEIGEHQLGLDGLDVGDRVVAVVDMGDVGVLEAAHHMRDGIDLADHGEELVAKALAARCAADEPGDVHERKPRRDDFRGFGELRQHVKARIGYRNLADIGFEGAERIFRRLRRDRRCQGVEKGGFAHIGQSDDAAFEAHR